MKHKFRMYGANIRLGAATAILSGVLTLGATTASQTFSLQATNEFSSVTAKKGIVSAACDGAIPTDADIILAGGTVNMNANALDFGSISETNGVLQTVTGEWKLDAADIVAGKRIRVMGEVVFGSTAALVVTGDTSLLDPMQKYTIFEATDGTFSGLPSLGNIRGWRVRRVNNTLCMEMVDGLFFIIH